MLSKLSEFADRHFVTGWRETWGDFSTAAMAVLSALVAFLSTNGGELISLIAFVPEGPAQGLAALGIFAALFVPGMLSKWWNQKEPSDDEAEV